MSDIAINPVTRRVQFTGNTGTGPYAFTFNILVDGDIAVFKGTTELTLTTDYTVSINANGTGSITLAVALIASDVLTIIGGRELSRTTDFVTAGDLLASSLNEQLDSNVIMTQQLDEKLGRGLFVNPGDVFTNLELPLKDDRKGTVLGFNATTGDPEPGPEIADVDSLANISADIKTLAEIQDGTVATDAITNVNTIRANVTTVSGISGNVTTVAGISSDVTTVAADGTDIGIVAGSISNVNNVGGSISNVNTVAGSISNVNTVSGDIADVNTVAGISSDVSTVSGISADVTTVAADGTDIGVVAGISSDVTTVSGISANVTTVAGINAAVSTVAADQADIGVVSTNIASVNTVSTNIASINTNTANITDIQNASANAATATTQAGIATTQAGIATTKASEASASEIAAEAAKVAAEAALDEFTDIYLGAKASDPTTDNDGNALTAGDQYFNTTLNVLKIYNGSAWQAAAIDSSGFVETTGDSMTGNLSFGDNDKAIFGAGSDLQIYHDGSNSYISEQGTGDLRLRADNLHFADANGTTSFYAIADGAVYLYHDGSTKLATTSTGVDITGTLTSDGLTSNKNINSTTVPTARSDYQISVEVDGAHSGDYVGGIAFGDQALSTAQAAILVADRGASAATGLSIATGNSAAITQRMRIDDIGDISFYEDTGTTPKFFWDASAESLGIGTSSIDYTAAGRTVVHVEGSAGALLAMEDTGARSYFFQSGNDLFLENDTASGSMIFGTNNSTARMSITSSGNVGIGTSSPSTNYETALHLNAPSFVNLHLTTNSTGTTGSDGFNLVTSSASTSLINQEATPLIFSTSGTERMRLDASGNLLVGESSNFIATSTTATGLAVTQEGRFTLSRSGTPMNIGRLGTDGSLIDFWKNGSTVGSIGVYSSDNLYLQGKSDHSGLAFGEAEIYGFRNGSENDGVTSLGSSAGRFKDLYLSGTIEIENGTGNVGVGKNALRINTASNNTAVGYQAAYSISTSANNTIMGYQAGYSQATGSGANALFGIYAGNGATSTYNTMIGPYAGYLITSGDKNTILGGYSGNQGGLDIRTSSNNIVLSDGDGNPRGIFNSSGQLMVGTTSPTSAAITTIRTPGASGAFIPLCCEVGITSSGFSAISFVNPAGQQGSIAINVSSTSYNTTSDYRLKENVVYDWDATTRLKQLKPARFNFIADADTTVDGFLAHEAQEIVPECVTGTKDAVDADGVAVMQGIDQSKLVPLLVKTIQELEARITALENA